MFDKYEVYTVTQSIYCYEDTKILKNKLNIKTAELLKEAEDEITTKRIAELAFRPITGNFSPTQLMNIHRYILGDVYKFAGKTRKEDIYKGRTRFMPNNLINDELVKLLNKLKEERYLKGFSREDFVRKLAYYMAELNIIHQFREGNGRTIREFIRLLANENGYFLDWSKLKKKELLDATIDSYLDATALQKCLGKALEG